MINIKIESFLQSQHKYINSLLLLIAACFVFIFDSNATDRMVYLHCLPFIFLCVVGVFVYHYKRTIGLQGYKRYLEQQINLELEKKTIFYGELGLKYLIKKDVLGAINFFVYIPIYCGLVYISYINNPSTAKYANMNIVIGVLFLIACLPIIKFSKKIEDKSLEMSEMDLVDLDQ